MAKMKVIFFLSAIVTAMISGVSHGTSGHVAQLQLQSTPQLIQFDPMDGRPPSILEEDGHYEGLDNENKKCEVDVTITERGMLRWDMRFKPTYVKVSTNTSLHNFTEVELRCSRDNYSNVVECVGGLGIQGDGLPHQAVTFALNTAYEKCHPQDHSYCINGPFVTYYNETRDLEVHCSSLKKQQ